MYCRFCGAEIQETDQFCKKCGKLVQDTAIPAENPVVSKGTQVQPINRDKPGFCPNCGAGLECCQPIPKVKTKTTGGGFSIWDGCCGMILLGPAGLLCGICGAGTKTEVRSETWFVCQKCGTEFMSKQSILNNAFMAMRSSFLYTAFLAFGIADQWGGKEALWFIPFCIAIIIGLWGSIVWSVGKSAGRGMKELLTDDEQITFWGKFLLYLIGSIALGLILGR